MSGDRLDLLLAYSNPYCESQFDCQPHSDAEPVCYAQRDADTPGLRILGRLEHGNR